MSGPQNFGTQDWTYPNGIVVAYYNNGPGTACKKQLMDANDYKAALAGPAAEAAKWALSPQGTVTDASVTRPFQNGCYSGFMGNF